MDDDYHGYNAVSRLQFLKEKYNDDDYNMICGIIVSHCLDDSEYLDVASEFNITDIKRFYKLLSIVKDADGLDRVREYPYTDINYLRINSSKRLLKLSCELFYNFDANNSGL